MPPARTEDDWVTAEYDVYITSQPAEQLYLLNFPNRPSTRPYNQASGSRPSEMRIKPKSGFLELEVKLKTESNFNKFRGLQWGESVRAAKQLHNASGTFGPAAGLASARPRPGGGARTALKDRLERDEDVRMELDGFTQREREGQVFRAQTLGGQILRHDSEHERGKPKYFVGAFEGGQLHLSQLAGTVQMRQQFHHLDAEDLRNSSVAQTARDEAARGGPAPVARALQARFMTEDEKGTPEARMRSQLADAEHEKWRALAYVDEDDDEAFGMFHAALFVHDSGRALTLRSALDDDGYLDAISARIPARPRRRKKESRAGKAAIRLEDEDDLDEEEDEE